MCILCPPGRKVCPFRMGNPLPFEDQDPPAHPEQGPRESAFLQRTTGAPPPEEEADEGVEENILEHNALPIIFVEEDGTESTAYVPIIQAIKDGLISVADAIARGYTTEQFVAEMRERGFQF